MAARRAPHAVTGRLACANCLRRSWLLESLGAPLDYCARNSERLIDALALDDRELLKALAGRRKEELATRHTRFDPRQIPLTPGIEAICRHDPDYPQALLSPAAPQMLHVSPSVERLCELTARPVVAILGTRRASDYGAEIAKSIARELTASGVAVASGLSDGIAQAAQIGALEANGGALLAMPGGVDVPSPAKRRSLYERVKQHGCAVSELPCASRPRRWGAAANERLLAVISAVTIVVEADDSPRELAGANIAQALGRTVAAVPGRVTSPSSRGCHALLIEGACLVRGAADALELLYPAGPTAVGPTAGAGDAAGAAEQPDEPSVALEPRLRSVLEQVGAGLDSPERLAGERHDVSEVLLTLSELELMGLLTRGDGGRYVPRQPLAGRTAAGRTARHRRPGRMEP